jgi:serine/threonine-protein kinase
MATVYIGRAVSDLGLGQAVALKVLHPHLAEHTETVERLVDEARIAGRIHHPNVVRLLDATQEDNNLFLVLEYVHGCSLADLLAASRESHDPPTPGVVASIAHQAFLGLHGAHEVRGEDGQPLDVVHRDVSPQNILVSSAGTAHVADFGIARASQRIYQTHTKSVVGKISYMSPEQLASDPVTRRTDLYAMGIVLWEALAGEVLFPTQAARASALTPGWTPPRPSERNREVSPQLDAVVLRLLATEPERRFATAEAAAAALAAACPLAPATEVTDWVRGVASDRLEILEDLLQSALRSEVSLHEMAARRRSTPSRPAEVPVETVETVETVKTVVPPVRRRAALVVLLAAVAVLLGFAALRFSRRAGATEARGVVDAAAPALSTPPPTDPVSSAPISPPVDSTSERSERGVADAGAPRSPGPRRPRQGGRPDAGAKSAASAAKACDPPYFIDKDGIKIYRPECVVH